MRRRDFLALAGAAAAFPRIARAQQAREGRPQVIAYLTTETEEQADSSSLGPFRKGLNGLGYVEGRDFLIVARYGWGNAKAMPGLAQEVVGLMPDLILTGNDVSTLAASDATKIIPVVAYFGGASADTVLETAIGNMSKPVGNVTGTFTDSTKVTGKHCDLALEIVPTAMRIGALAFSLNPDGGKGTHQAVTAAAEAHKVGSVIIDVAQPGDLAPAFQSLAAQKVDVVVVGSGGVFSSDRARVAQLAADARLPAIYNEQGYVEAGGLISYGFNRAATFARLASFAELILKGAQVADVPSEETSVYFTAINLRAAKALGLTIPPTVLFRADEVLS